MEESRPRKPRQGCYSGNSRYTIPVAAPGRKPRKEAGRESGVLSRVCKEGAVRALPLQQHLAREGDPVYGWSPAIFVLGGGWTPPPPASPKSEVLLILCLPVAFPLYQAQGSSSQTALGHFSRVCSGPPLPASHVPPSSLSGAPFAPKLRRAPSSLVMPPPGP